MVTKQSDWMPAKGQAEPPQVAEPPDGYGTLVSEEYTVQTMPKVVNASGLAATFVLIIFFITNVPSAVGAGAGTFTFWVIGAITFFIPCVIATAQLGHMFPHEGSLYNWTHRAFGGYMSFFVAFCAWFPCVLLMIVAADVIVGYLQGLNSHWLVQPWQQGLVLIGIIAFSGVLAVQRTAMILKLVKVVLVFAFVAVFLVGLAGVVWLVGGHHIDKTLATNTPAAWGFAWNPSGYYTLALFAFITQAFLGIEVPLNMAGEMTGHKVVTRHLLWGALLVLVGYFITSFGVLVVTGTTQTGVAFALVTAVQMALGKTAGYVVAILVLCNFVVTPAIYSYAYARLLLAGGIDQRLPVRIAKLNKNRVPATAIIFQTMVAMALAAILFIAVPSLTTTTTANATTLNTIVYNVVISASTLVWAISTAFLFIDLVKFYLQDRKVFRRLLIFPMPVLWISIVLGTASCVVSIIGALVYSLIPNLLDNSKWWYIVGGITLACIIVAAIGSMFANSEASWQTLREEN
jgi:amino acid transporter